MLIPPSSVVVLRVFYSSFLACRKLHYFMQAVMDTVRLNGSRLHARLDVLQLTAKHLACSLFIGDPNLDMSLEAGRLAWILLELSRGPANYWKRP